MMFTDALSYPFRQSGWIMILVGSMFSAVLDLLQFAPLVGFVVGIFSAGYFGAFYLDIINTTIIGRDETPEWPGMSSFLDDILSPFLRLVWLVLISFGPLFAVGIFADEDAPWMIAAVIGAIAYGCFYFPMAVLAMQAFGGFGATLPHMVIPAIFRGMPGYLLAVVSLFVVFVVCELTQEFSAKIPYVGWFLTAAVALYGLMFQGRLIGLFYREKADRLGWE